MSDLAKEIAQTVVRIKTEMRKASFASRSEAGRYAANQRWKNQGKKAKTPLDDLSIRGMTPEKMALDELRAHVEEQRGLLDAMRGVASKAELQQQTRLINLAEADLRRMEREQAKAEPPKSTHRASYLEYRVTNKQGRDKAFSEAMIMKAGKGLNEKYGAPLATKDDVAFAAQVKDDLETAIAPLEKEVRDVLGKLDANEGDRATNLKSLQRVKTKFAALARKSEKDAKASGDYANALEENTIRTMITRTRTMIFESASRDVGFVLDQEKAIDKGLQSRMSKGKSFASRSEAGRYAANMRWKGQGAANTASGRASDGGYANTTGAAADGERQPEDKFDMARVGGTALYLMSYGPGQIRRDAAGYHATDKNNISLFGRQELEGERTASTPPKTLAEAKRLIEQWDANGRQTLVKTPEHKVDFKVNESGRFTHVEGFAFDGQVSYKIGNENEFPDDMDYGFAFKMPGQGLIYDAILKSGFSKKVMSNTNDTPSLDKIKSRAVELNQELGRAVSDHLKTLNIREIAKGIEQEYSNTKTRMPKSVTNAVAALKPLRDINDVYGYSTGQRIVADALKSLKGFDSEVGKMVQAELKSRVKDAAPKPPTAGMRRAKSLPFAELRSN